MPRVPPDQALRLTLEAYASLYSATALHARLAALDPVAAERLDYRNVRRVVRALEVCLLTGERISDLQRKSPPPYRVLWVGLIRPRPALYERVDARIEAMLEAVEDPSTDLLDAVRQPRQDQDIPLEDELVGGGDIDCPRRVLSSDEKDALLEEFEKENKGLRKENAKLKQENTELKARLNSNSKNSHKPPSSDGYKKQPALPKKKNGRQGGQKGHKGSTLH